MCGLDHVGFPLRDLLAALLRDDLAELVSALAQLVVHVPEVLRALDPGELAPLLERRVGGVDRRLDVFGRPALERAERLAGRRVLALEGLRASARDPFAVDVVLIRVRHGR